MIHSFVAGAEGICAAREDGLEMEYVKWRSGRGHAGTWKMREKKREKQRQLLQPASKQQGWWISARTMQEMTLCDQGLILSLLFGIHLRA